MLASPTDEALPRANFRPDIAMLRAVAVTMVLGFHVLPARVKGGYTGVDIFFVISGFLMTAHIRRGAYAGTFSFRQFYLRRAYRLLPAASTVTALTLLAVLLVVPQVFWIPFAQQGLASALYVENLKLAVDSVDYLALASGASPFQHYWSLSAEEQFYLLWPLLIVVLVALGPTRQRWGRDGCIVGVAVVAALSFGWSVYATSASPATAYFSTLTRLWEFAVGALVALLPVVRKLPRAVHLPLWVAAFAVVCASAFAFDTDSAFPGAIAAVPVVATATLVALGTPGSPGDAVSRAVAWSPVQGLGRISYSVYLIHWPLIVLTPFVLDGRPSGPTVVVGWLAASLVLGTTLWFLVERRGQHLPPGPLRVGTHRTDAGRATASARGWTPHRFPALVAGVVVTCCLASGVWATAVRRQDDAAAVLDRVSAAAGPCFGAGVFGPMCNTAATPGRPIVPIPAFAPADNDHKSCLQAPQQASLLVCHLKADGDTALRVAVVGDSHAAHWVPAVMGVAATRRWSVDTYVKSSCPLSDVTLSNSGSAGPCRSWNTAVMSRLTQERYDVVIVSAAAGERYAHAAGETSDIAAAAGMSAQWRRLGAVGTRIVAIHDNPRPGRAGIDSPPACVEASGASRCTFAHDPALPTDPQVAAVEAVETARLADLTAELCPDARCSSVIGGVMVYRDESHLTATYAATLGAWLDHALPAAL